MITNEKQYRITRAWVKKFETALAAAQSRADNPADTTPPKLLEARQNQMLSQLEEFREDLSEYEALRQGRVDTLELADLDDLPAALIRARVAAGLTQAQLAGRLGVKTQQVQRDEANLYRHVSFERMAKVAEALGVKLHGEVVLH